MPRNRLLIRYLLVILGFGLLQVFMRAGGPQGNVEMTVRETIPWFLLAAFGGALVLVGMMSDHKESIGPTLLGTIGGAALMWI